MSPPTSLRRADWRFLLPDPAGGGFEHLVLLGMAPGLAERIVTMGLARRVSCEIPGERSADAVIILHNARAVLGDVAGCLRPGGMLYYEIERRAPSLSSMPARIRYVLRNIGLWPMATYWVSPNFSRPRIYVPLDVPGALRWYLTTFHTATTLAQRVLEVAQRTVAPFDERLHAQLVHCYAMTAIAGPIRDAPPSVLGHPALPPAFRRSDLRPLVLTPGEDDLNRVVMLPFGSDRNGPVGVLKLSRLPDRNIVTEDEQTALTTIRMNLDAAMRPTIPEPLGTVRWGRLTVGIESCAPGRLLSTSTGRWGAPLRQKIDDLRRAVAWLCEFHCQTQLKRSPWGDSELREWVERPLAAYEQAFGVTADERRLFARVRQRASSLVGIPAPTVLVHWNFSLSHLFCTAHEITVVDWEGVSPGPFLFDLLFFVMRWNYTVRYLRGRAARLRGFRDLFCAAKPTDSVARAAHRAIAEYMAGVGIDHRFLPLLLVLMCVVRGLGRLNRLDRVGEQGHNGRAGNQYVGYVAVLAEHVEQLFRDDDPQ